VDSNHSLHLSVHPDISIEQQFCNYHLSYFHERNTERNNLPLNKQKQLLDDLSQHIELPLNKVSHKYFLFVDRCSDASNQSKLSFSLAAIKVAARDPAAVANFLTSPTLLPLPVPISIAAARSKTSSGSSSTSKGNSNNKNIEF